MAFRLDCFNYNTMLESETIYSLFMPSSPSKRGVVRLHLHSDDFDTLLPKGRESFKELRKNRPQTTAECPDDSKPCPFITCQEHMLPVVNLGRGKLLRLAEMPNTCFLRAMPQNPENGGGGLTYEETAEALGINTSSVDAAEEMALHKLKRSPNLREIYTLFRQTYDQALVQRSKR